VENFIQIIEVTLSIFHKPTIMWTTSYTSMQLDWGGQFQ